MTASPAGSTTGPSPAGAGTASVEICGIVSDVTERRRMEDELREAHRAAEARATTDELTGVPSTAATSPRCGRGADRARPRVRPAAAGRRPLQAHQRRPRPRRRGRRAGRAGRRLERSWGPTTSSPAGAARSSPYSRAASTPTRRSRGAPSELLDVVALDAGRGARRRAQLTISIGGIHAGDGLCTLDALIEHADRHLYAAKRDGRNRAWVPHDAQTAFTARLG